MDYPLPPLKTNRLKWFRNFQYLDLVPYSVAMLMIAGSIYIVTTFIELTKHVK